MEEDHVAPMDEELQLGRVEEIDDNSFEPLEAKDDIGQAIDQCNKWIINPYRMCLRVVSCASTKYGSVIQQCILGLMFHHG